MSSKNIVKKYSSLVRRYLKTFEIPSSYPGDKSDLYQVGLIGVIKALDTHNPNRSKISTWAWYWIRSEIRSEVSKNSKRLRMYDDLTYIIKEKVLIMQLVEMIEIPKDKEVVIRYLSGQQSNEIGDEWNVTRQCIEQRLRRAIKNIKEKVNAERRRVHSSRGVLQDRDAKDRLDSPISC